MRRARRAAALVAVLGACAAVRPARGEDGSKAVAVKLSGFRFLAGPPPAGWTAPGFDDHLWGGPAPVGGMLLPRGATPPPASWPPPPGPPPSGPPATPFDPVRGAPLLLRAAFDVEQPARARVLELRIAYADGFVAYLNGREVARRGLPPGSPVPAGPAQPHGPEVEHVYVPVPPPAPPPAAGALKASGNLLAVEVYAQPARSMVAPTAPAATVDVIAASGVRIVRGPYLVAPSENDRQGAAVSVAWETDLPATGAVTVEAADGAGAPGHGPRRIETRALATRQVVTLDGLGQGRRYRYRVEAAAAAAGGAASAGPFTFATWAGARQPLRFAVYGDMRYPGHVAHRAVVEALAREAPPLVFNTGDLTDAGSEESNWQRYFEITAPLGAIAPVLPAFGNHDVAHAGLGAPKTWALFGLTSAAPSGASPGWTSLDLGGAHFVLLDTNQVANPAQKSWLTADLADARRRRVRAIFVFCHEGPWSHGLHGNFPVMIHDYAPILAAAHVDVLFTGHDHTYERGAGTTPAGKLTYVVSGGGGAPPYNPTCRAATGPPPGDVPGPLPPCPSSVATLTKAYHYIIVEVSDDGISMCPRRPDGSAVEPCVRLPRHAR